jgi:hypothetical protein
MSVAMSTTRAASPVTSDGTKRCSVLYKKVTASPEPAKPLRHRPAHAAMGAAQAPHFLKRLDALGRACAPSRAPRQ